MTTKNSLILILCVCCVLIHQTEQITCHYTCETCYGEQYFECLTCKQNRGQADTRKPISGMCYCNEQTDEDIQGICLDTKEFNYNNKALIAVFIGLSILFSLIIMLLTGGRYFFIKTIEDVQQISIIVFMNLYYPQQLDIFLTHLYRFNISSFTFQAMTSGSLFVMNNQELVDSTDGQNIQGKYKLVYKTANFFSNQFTWLIVTFCLVFAAFAIRFTRKYLKNRKQSNQSQSSKLNTQQSIGNESISMSSNKQESIDHNLYHVNDAEIAKKKYQTKIKKKQKEQTKQDKCYSIINRIYNMVWYNFLIVYFYLSLTEININIFTQIANLTFSSSFSAAGAYFSAVFLAGQIVVLFLLVLKIKEQSIKPQWMRDYAFSSAIHYIRINYKSITKYFWVICSVKKIIIALFMTIFYYDPSSAIIAVCCTQVVFIGFSLYCQPFQRRYLRLHFYLMQSIKTMIYFSMINFSQKYLGIVRMIEITKIKFIMLSVMFGINFGYIVFSMIIQRNTYARYFIKKFCPQNQEEYEFTHGKVGYYSQGKIYLYQQE